MAKWLSNLFSRKPLTAQLARPRATEAKKVNIRARFDVAQTTPENWRHWAYADAFSASAAATPMVRRILRIRARYEIANNSYARGIISTLANDCVGTGPRLQVLTDKATINNQLEAAFSAWATAVKLPQKLRTMRMAKAGDGEAFGLMVSNPKLDNPVKLDLRLLEAEQVATPMFIPSEYADDGVRFDAHGNPTEYDILKRHPGSFGYANLLDYYTVPAEAVLHYFNTDRPGQRRGIPEILPALPLFAQLRRYTQAVAAAAEAAADFALVVYTDAPANGESDPLEPMDTIELESRMATIMPAGWKLGQAKAEQPTTTYREFHATLLNEIARCLNMPYNIAAGNSSGYNYSSGRLDHQTYYKSIRVEQSDLEDEVLDHLFSAWLQEAVLIEGFLPQSLRMRDVHPAHQWMWDGAEHVDPVKEANAQQIRLISNTTTLAAEFARQGKDWEKELTQRAREVKKCLELGLTPILPAPVPAKETVPPEETDEETPADD